MGGKNLETIEKAEPHSPQNVFGGGYIQLMERKECKELWGE